MSARKVVDVRITGADVPEGEAGVPPHAVNASVRAVRIMIKRYKFNS